jgi:putative addiction module killer protein
MRRDLESSSYVLYKGQEFAIEQTAEFAAWLTRLRDAQGRVRILKRLRRLADGEFGNYKPVGEGVHELRMFFGPGYRVYFMLRGDVLILLLAGGDKDSQDRDIALAKGLARKDRDGTENDAV